MSAYKWLKRWWDREWVELQWELEQSRPQKPDNGPKLRWLFGVSESAIRTEKQMKVRCTILCYSSSSSSFQQVILNMWKSTFVDQQCTENCVYTQYSMEGSTSSIIYVIISHLLAVRSTTQRKPIYYSHICCCYLWPFLWLNWRYVDMIVSNFFKYCSCKFG